MSTATPRLPELIPPKFTTLNAHPVHHTGLISRRRDPTYYVGEHQEAESQQSIEPKHFDVQSCLGPLPLDPPSENKPLPPNWARSNAINLATDIQIHQTLVVFLPKDVIRKDGSMEFVTTYSEHQAIVSSWCFIVKALTCKFEGSWDPIHTGKNHWFTCQSADGLREFRAPKIEMFGEVIVHDFRGILKDYAFGRYAREENESPEQHWKRIPWNDIVTELEFRRRLYADKNFIGVRYFIHILDKRLDAGRAFQHLIWRNSVNMGETAPINVLLYEDEFKKAWQEKKKKAVSPAASGDIEQQEDEGPGYHNSPMSEIGEDYNHPDDAAAMGEEEPDAEAEHDAEEGDSTGEGGAKKKKKKKKQTTRPPTEAQLKAKEENFQRARLARRGIEIKGTNMLTKNYRWIILFDKTFRTLYNHELKKLQANPAGGMVTRLRGDNTNPDLPEINNHTFQLVVSTYLPVKDIHKFTVKDLKSLANLYSALTCRPVAEGLGDAFFQQAETDLGDYQHALHPNKHFTFERTTNAWLINHDRPYLAACPEQTRECFYYSRVSKEFQFPIPSLAFRFPQGDRPYGLHFTELLSKAIFFYFSPFMELLETLENKMHADEQRAYRRTINDIDVSLMSVVNSNIDKEEVAPLQISERQMLEKARLANPNLGEDFVNGEEIRYRQWQRGESQRVRMANNMRAPDRYSLLAPRVDRGNNRNDDDEPDFMACRAAAADLIASGVKTPAQQIEAQMAQYVVQSIMGDQIKEADNLYRRLTVVANFFPQYRNKLMCLFREHQYRHVYMRCMQPGTRGLNEIHKLHANFLVEGCKAERKLVHFRFTGYENLTMFGSQLAEFYVYCRNVFQLNNSLHVFQIMIYNIGANVYRSKRKIPLHVCKFGSAGVGKSWLDNAYKSSKVTDTVIDALHISNCAKMVEVDMDDRVYIQDEAQYSLVSDTTKAKDSSTHQAGTLTKATLSLNYVSFMIYERAPDGSITQRRKQVAARSSLVVNMNDMPVNADMAIYDRFLVFVIAPWSSPSNTHSEFLSEDIDPDLRHHRESLYYRLQILDTLVFRMCKMIDLSAAADPNIINFTMHLMLGLPKLKRYGILSDLSKRLLQKGHELAITNVITSSIITTFSGGWNPVLATNHGNQAFHDLNDEGPDVSQQLGIGRSPLAPPTQADTHFRPWSEEYLKQIRYRLFITEDQTIFTLSQVFRLILRDYPGWDMLNYIVRTQGGYTSAYFAHLFHRENPTGAWEKKVTPEGKVKYKQKFPFTCMEKILKRRSQEEVPNYVKAEELMLKQFEVEGLIRHGIRLDGVANQHKHPHLYAVEHHPDKFNDEQLANVREDRQRRYDIMDAELAKKEKGLRDRLEAGEVPLENGASDFDINRALAKIVADRKQLLEDLKKNAANLDIARAPDTYLPDRPIPQAQARPNGTIPPGKSAPPAPIWDIDPNWIVIPGSVEHISHRYMADMTSNISTTWLIVQRCLELLATSKKVVVPVLEHMSQWDEMPKFATVTNAETGEKEIETKTVSLIRFETQPNNVVYLNSNEENNKSVAGMRLPPRQPRMLINTMAIACFHPMKALFEFLTAAEYHFTPDLTVPIDLCFRGQDGVNYTHTTKQKKGKPMKRRMASTLSSSVYQQMFQRHTVAAIARMPGETTYIDPSLDPDLVRQRVIAREATGIESQTSHLYAQYGGATRDGAMASLLDGDAITADDAPLLSVRGFSKKDIFGRSVAEKTSVVVEKRVRDEINSLIAAKEIANARFLPRNDPDIYLGRSLVAAAQQDIYYLGYHIPEEYEEWMEREYGKVSKSGSPLSKKWYFPGRTERIWREDVLRAPEYRRVRYLGTAKLLQYPEDVLRASDNQIDPGRRMLRAESTCDHMLKAYKYLLYEKWLPFGKPEHMVVEKVIISWNALPVVEANAVAAEAAAAPDPAADHRIVGKRSVTKRARAPPKASAPVPPANTGETEYEDPVLDTMQLTPAEDAEIDKVAQPPIQAYDAAETEKAERKQALKKKRTKEA